MTDSRERHLSNLLREANATIEARDRRIAELEAEARGLVADALAGIEDERRKWQL